MTRRYRTVVCPGTVPALTAPARNDGPCDGVGRIGW